MYISNIMFMFTKFLFLNVLNFISFGNSQTCNTPFLETVSTVAYVMQFCYLDDDTLQLCHRTHTHQMHKHDTHHRSPADAQHAHHSLSATEQTDRW